MLAVLYRYGPSRTEARWRWVSWGGAFAAIGWVLISLAFSWYVAHFGSYNKTYGSLGAAIGFMTWIWISATILLVGAELNAEMEHQTERDTTIGERGRSARVVPTRPTRWRPSSGERALSVDHLHGGIDACLRSATGLMITSIILVVAGYFHLSYCVGDVTGGRP